VSGFVSVSSFRVDDATADALDELLRVLSTRPGFRSGSVSRSTEEPATLLLLTQWDGAGWWRRALGAYDVRLIAVPLLALAVREPSAFEVVLDR
jgi:hypothetical protein